jgi:hypothetical protein
VTRTLSRNLKSTAVAVVIGATLVMMTASQAMAAVVVSQSSANAVGGNVVNSGLCNATNDQTVAAPGTQTGVAGTGAIVNLNLGCTAAGSGTNSGSLLSAAVAVQTAVADPAGNPLPSFPLSGACAGVSGTGAGAIQVGAAASCTASGTGSGVNVLSNIITADAIFATCTDTSGTPAGASTLVDASVGGPLANLLASLGVVGGLGSLLTNPPVNDTIPVGLTLLGSTTPLLTIVLNAQSTSGGTLTVTALTVTVLPGLVNLGLGITGLVSGLVVKIGTVTCGPNALVPATSALPSKALPIAGGVVILAAGGAYIGRRRLFAGFRG